ncbi:putative ATP-dependent DNA ligase [Methanocella paludicola SANAE]|uniref:ATP-dependent DNA ligase n=1 Tax=Methanocella paludicola (strain DSM 17711 / JCM 13418 / NBRC 101707 / SANAE) TaxID=304371 RepID=D1Z0H6_METPS|nr:non-homologous end-joining DNA ligase [Methanocella paludicola]BAI62198.1 putative ATP-dependent DNA ligase [Methanocella paludicola SANAE]
MDPLLERLPPAAKEKLVKMEQPEWEEPMLATLTSKRFDDHGWAFGHKLDGARCLAYRKDGHVRLMSRTRHEMNASYPEVADALMAQKANDFIIDGEIVALDENGNSKFELLQPRMGLEDPAEARRTGIPVHYYVFDILFYDGYELTRLPLLERKHILEKTLDYGDTVRFLEDRLGGGLGLFDEACKKGWEGLIAKRAYGPYVHGRSDEWLKFKCVQNQEFVIGGYTEPHGKRIEFGAILVGYYQDGKLMYAGKVGTGFDEKTLRSLMDKFRPLERKASPFAEEVREKEVHWLEPKLVAEIGFEEWTDYGKLRQPRYDGLRYDKDPHSVIREVPK